MFLQIFPGALYALSFKPIGLWFLAPIAIALQIYLLRRYRSPEIQSFIFAFVSSLIILNWSKTFVGALPWIALAVLQGCLAIPIGVIARFTKSFAPIAFGILLMEEIRARFPFGGFSWTRIAFSQIDSPFAKIVAITGVIGLSLITLLLAQLILDRRIRLLILPLGLLVATFFVPASTSDDTSIRIRAIQGGVPERGLEFNQRAQAVLDNHIKVTLRDFQSSDELIIWPENAIDIDPLRNAVVERKIVDLAGKTKRPLVAGAILDRDKIYNSTIYFDVDGSINSTYIKRYLTPFGEYIPLRSIAALFSPHVKRVNDFSPGEDLIVHQLPQGKVGSIICYEILNDGLVREMALNSDFLVVHTNSATFSGSSEGEQQLAITRLRALESGKSIVSVSTTGPSAIIDARGVVLSKLSDGEVGSLSADIPLVNETSFAHKLGGYGTLIALLLTFIWALSSLRWPIDWPKRGRQMR
jgi:apolipoprotein N-acyltransferase